MRAPNAPQYQRNKKGKLFMSEKPKALFVGKDMQKKGNITWSGSGCQTCFAVLDLESSFTLNSEAPVHARLELRPSPNGDHHILKITETK